MFGLFLTCSQGVRAKKRDRKRERKRRKKKKRKKKKQKKRRNIFLGMALKNEPPPPPHKIIVFSPEGYPGNSFSRPEGWDGGFLFFGGVGR